MINTRVSDSLWERFYWRGQRYMADRDYQGAVAEFKKVLGGLPHHRGAHYLLAESLLWMGRVQEAIAVLKKMRGIFPADPRAALALGRLLLKTGRKAEGIEALEQALAITQDETVEHLQAARKCRTEGDVSRALSELQEGCLGLERAAKLRLSLVNFFFTEKRVDDAFRIAQVDGAPAIGERRPSKVGHG
jgi:tetratricopeptide (TPR) repeat protein